MSFEDLALSWNILVFLSSQIFHKITKTILAQIRSLLALDGWSISSNLSQLCESLGVTMDHWKAYNTSDQISAVKGQLINK